MVDYKYRKGMLENRWIGGRAAWNEQLGGEEWADYRLILNSSSRF